MSNTKDDVDELGTSFATISPMSTSSQMSLSKQLTMYVKLIVQLLPLIVTIFLLDFFSKSSEEFEQLKKLKPIKRIRIFLIFMNFIFNLTTINMILE
jgi:hypothetical protein